jgi:hypothetical protein
MKDFMVGRLADLPERLARHFATGQFSFFTL